MADAVYGHQQRGDFHRLRIAGIGRGLNGGTDYHLLGRDHVSYCEVIDTIAHTDGWINLCTFSILPGLRISEPSVRGILTACAGISATTGIFLVFLLGSLIAWRDVALICAFVPLVTMVAVCFVSNTFANIHSRFNSYIQQTSEIIHRAFVGQCSNKSPYLKCLTFLFHVQKAFITCSIDPFLYFRSSTVSEC